MTDITELAQSLKAAANTTADAIDRLKAFPGDELIDLSQHEGEKVDIDITTLNEWYELSSPANILALVEALEKAQSKADVYDMLRDDYGLREKRVGLADFVDWQAKRIAELESSTVTVKLASRRLPSDYVDGEFGNDDLAAIHNACRLECKVSVEKYLSAHGIVVKWEDE